LHKPETKIVFENESDYSVDQIDSNSSILTDAKTMDETNQNIIPPWPNRS
jgi:hypothetical protein